MQFVGQCVEDEGEFEVNGDDVDQVGVMVYWGLQKGGMF